MPKQEKDTERPYRMGRLLAVVALTLVILAAVSAAVDVFVLGW